MTTAIVVFAISYVLVTARRLQWLPIDRPAGALVGAVLTVAAGVLTPEQALQAIDGHTLLLLFGVMGLGAFLSIDGFFDVAEAWLVMRARTPARLVGFVVWGAGILSAFITNDAVCVLGAPVIVRMIRTHDLPRLPLLLALATASNTGSVATLVGNPQNMLCGLLGGLEYRDHLALMAPVAAVGLAINHAAILIAFRPALRAARLRPVVARPPLSPRAVASLLVVVASAIGFTLGADLAWTATGAFALLMLLHRRDTRPLWHRIDATVLLFFAGLFVVVGGLVHSGAPAAFFARHPLGVSPDDPFGWWRLSAIFLVGSNVVSNVPFILVVRDAVAALPDARAGWELLAMASTFAGNLTLIGSVANIIVAENAREIGGLGFVEYLRVGAPVALLTTAAGTAWMQLAGVL
ncbi:MAG: SLC13 family permease [Myxococcota bacterium]|nr:SLC13 family permease [Myxococcota bacterium]MDW8363415.1 SLC13 family permease [Myxococcales bacterium]